MIKRIKATIVKLPRTKKLPHMSMLLFIIGKQSIITAVANILNILGIYISSGGSVSLSVNQKQVPMETCHPKLKKIVKAKDNSGRVLSLSRVINPICITNTKLKKERMTIFLPTYLVINIPTPANKKTSQPVAERIVRHVFLSI